MDRDENEDYEDFEACLLKKDEAVDKLVEETVQQLIIIYEEYAIEHIFDRDSILGLAERIKKRAEKEPKMFP